MKDRKIRITVIAGSLIAIAAVAAILTRLSSKQADVVPKFAEQTRENRSDEEAGANSFVPHGSQETIPNESSTAEISPTSSNPSPPRPNEMGEAVFLPDDPLSVVLPWYPEAGVISVEKWDSDGTPLGIPLKPGTQVGMPDPLHPDMKIHFRIPAETSSEQADDAN